LTLFFVFVLESSSDNVLYELNVLYRLALLHDAVFDPAAANATTAIGQDRPRLDEKLTH
jgi:hypothetical protein